MNLLTPALLVAVCMVVALLLYALMGGADFGGGMWDLFARGPRAERQRKAISRALAPIWEANHVWLILVIVLLFTGFPNAFAVMMTALHIPITLILLGIVVRGSAFVFRKFDEREGPRRRRWGILFGLSCVFTPFAEGITVGALATGDIRFVDGRVTTGFFAGWLTPFAVACGVFAIVLFAFLAATYLTVDREAEPDVREDFRRRALGAGTALVPIALVAFALSRSGAPELFLGMTRWWAPFLLGATALFGAAALAFLWRRRFALARIAAIGEVTLILAGWSLAQYPKLVTPDITFANSAAPDVTLRLLLIALVVGGLFLFPSLFFLFRLFKGGEARPPSRRDAAD